MAKRGAEDQISKDRDDSDSSSETDVRKIAFCRGTSGADVFMCTGTSQDTTSGSSRRSTVSISSSRFPKLDDFSSLIADFSPRIRGIPKRKGLTPATSAAPSSVVRFRIENFCSHSIDLPKLTLERRRRPHSPLDCHPLPIQLHLPSIWDRAAMLLPPALV